MAPRLLVQDSSKDIPHIAVAVRKLKAHDGRVLSHAAIFYRDADGSVHCLHLGGPGDLRRDRCSPSFGWVIPSGLKREEAILLADLCELIHARYKASGDIPYGLEYKYDSRFDCKTGQAIVGEKLRGFTCATFVLAVFNSYDIRILDVDTWDSRPEDIEWQIWVSENFRSPNMASELPCLRFRPEEIAGACMCRAYPVGFIEAEALGRQILSDLDDYLDRAGLPI